MAEISDLEAALVKADAAGNAEDAKFLADTIRQQRATAAQAQQKVATVARQVQQPQPAQPAQAPLGSMPGVQQFMRPGGGFDTSKYLSDGKAQMLQSFRDFKPSSVADMGLRAGLPAAGQALGTAAGPYAPVARPILGGAGGMAGDAIAQYRAIKAGEQPGGFRTGQMLGAGVAGAMPTPSLAGASNGAVAGQAALQGAGNVAAKAVETGVDQQRLPTMGEAATAGGMGAAGTYLAKSMDRGMNAPTVSAATKKAQDAEFVDILKSGQKEGYVIPPSFVKSGFLSNTAESYAGKAATIQQAVQQNQPNTNRLAREWLDLPESAPLNMKTIETAKAGPNAIYAKVADMSDEAKVMLEQYKQAKSDSRYNWNKYQSEMSQERLNPTVKKLAEKSDENAAEILTNLRKVADKTGNSGLMDKFSDAEVKLAKLGVAAKGIEGGNGRDISASAFTNPEGRGLTGEAVTIGKFYDAFDRAMRDAASSPAPGVNKLSTVLAGSSSGLGAVLGSRYGPAGTAMGAAAGLIPYAAQGPTRAALLSPYIQKNFVNPSHGATRPDMDALLAKFATQNAGR